MLASQYRHNHELFPHIIITNRLSSCEVVSHTSFWSESPLPIDLDQEHSGVVDGDDN